MLATLFSSRVRAKVLSALFLAPGEKLNATELTKRLGEHYSAVWKELVRLEDLGILTSEQRGGSKEYWVNEKNPIEPELRSIVLKTEGVGKLVKDELAKMVDLREAFIYGSFAAGGAIAQSDIDLMIIGGVDLSRLAKAISALENELNRQINYVIFTEPDWAEKAKENDPFWENVMKAPRIQLIGGANAI